MTLGAGVPKGDMNAYDHLIELPGLPLKKLLQTNTEERLSVKCALHILKNIK